MEKQRNSAGKFIPLISESLKKEWENLYLSGVTSPTIAQKYNVSVTTVCSYLNELGIKLDATRKEAQKYPKNETFFDVIDTESKAYWLGFFSADGHVNEDGVIKLTLAHKDRNHVEKFRDIICPSKPIYDQKQNGSLSSTVNIYSKHIAKSLNNLGLTHDKTYTLEACWAVPEKFLKDYWRGFVDGDGCIRSSIPNKFKRTKTPAWTISLLGTQEIVKEFRKFCYTYCATEGYFRKTRGEAWEVCFSGNDTVSVICYILYSNAEVSLTRKFNKAKDCCKQSGLFICEKDCK